MHTEAFAFVSSALGKVGRVERVVEFGGQDVNSTEQGMVIRDLFPDVEYLSVDMVDGPGVDLVADCASWRPDKPFDLVVCCEVLEHTPKASDIVASAHAALKPGGFFIMTAATDPRGPHCGQTGGLLQSGEWYANIDPDEFLSWGPEFEQVVVEVDRGVGDLRALLRREAV